MLPDKSMSPEKSASLKSSSSVHASRNGEATLSPALRDWLADMGVPREPTAVVIGNTWHVGSGAPLAVRSPIDGSQLVELRAATADEVAPVVAAAQKAFL